jgi:hypothetical protein
MKLRFSNFILITLFVTSIGCQSNYETKLRTLTYDLDRLVSELDNYSNNLDEIDFLIKNPKFTDQINELLRDMKLCSINKYSFGVAFNYSCSKLLDRKSNYSDKEYYLIKVIDLSEKDNFLGFEQFVDCGKKPEKLNDNWYFISKHHKCD